jgi:predicted transcriptional regulator
MPALSLRLPEDLDHRLDEEARREGVPRSEVARNAISEFLARREKERYLAELVAEAQSGYANETVRREALEIAEEGIVTGNETLDVAEGRSPGAPAPEEDGERWWK